MQAAFLDIRQYLCQDGEHDLDLSGQETRQRLTAAAIRYMIHFNLCARLQQFALDMRQRAIPGGGIVQLAWPLFRQANQFGYGFGGHRRMHGENLAGVRDTADRRKRCCVVADIFVNSRRDEKRARAS